MLSSQVHESRRSGGSRSLLRDSLSDQEMADLEAVVASAERMLGPDALPALSEIHDFHTASTALTSGWDVIRTALREGGRLAETVSTCESLDDLLHRMHHNAGVVAAAEVRHRDRSVRVARETLTGLQDMTSVAQLVEAGAEAACQLGFDRAIVSSVRDSMWLTESLYVDGDSEWATEILAAGRGAPQQVSSRLPEGDLVRRRRPIVVTRVQQRVEHSSVHEAVAAASQSRSYVAAPIMPRSKVIGFLHCDRYFHRGDVTQFDSDLLGLFAQGYGYALERALLLEELDGLRNQVRSIVRGLDDVTAPREMVDGFTANRRTEPVMNAPQGFRAGTVLHMQSEDHDSRLTRRELEVLKLMALGDTNVRIAHKLIISEGTVKSHVKHILRKLSAANRAEAVARWHSGAYAAG